MKFIEIKAPAKINIGLNIIAKRDDGFHNLETIFYPLNDLCDIIQIKKSDEFNIRCNIDTLEADKSNLVVKAVKLLEAYTNKNLNVDIHLQKNIPIGAGLGGGSSDAAATLISLNEMFTLGFEYKALLNIALELGSDVPFFIKAKPAFGQSRGELLRELDFEINAPILLVNPGIHISTKEAFGNISPNGADFKLEEIMNANKTDKSHIKKLIKNDFEKYIFSKYQVLDEIKNALYDNGSVLAQMSGSGSTIYGIFNSLQDAISAKSKFPKNYFKFISLP